MKNKTANRSFAFLFCLRFNCYLNMDYPEVNTTGVNEKLETRKNIFHATEINK